MKHWRLARTTYVHTYDVGKEAAEESVPAEPATSHPMVVHWWAVGIKDI